MRNKNYHIYGADDWLANLILEYKMMGFAIEYEPGHLTVSAQRPSDEEERKFMRVLNPRD